MSNKARVGIVTMEGTNNEMETFLSFQYSNSVPEIIHIKKLESGLRKFSDYDIIFFPGGFSAGDYVRAGAIMASRIRSRLIKDLEEFVENGNPVMGTCNGFQVLVELGLLPDTAGSYKTEAALAPNISNKFEARTVYVKVKKGNCLFLTEFEENQIIKLPIAHSEGRFIPKNKKILKEILKNGLNSLTYVNEQGKESGYPWNPNGSVSGIAGICNKAGNVLGVMPHPERVFNFVTESDWTRMKVERGIGAYFFDAAVRYSTEKF